MRIATSTTFDQQTSAIDLLSSQYQSIGKDLSSGKSLNVPSDDPSIVAQDLTLNNTINAEGADATNANSAQNQLTYTDSVLSSLTDILQKASSLAVEGATDIIPNGSQRPLIGTQIEGLLQQAIGLANSQYGNTYVFAGTGTRTTAPVTAIGSPPSGIAFSGNLNAQTEVINGVNVQTGTTLQQAFNYQSSDGTPDVFQLLATLRDTMDKEPAGAQSSAPINVQNSVIYGPGSTNPATGTQTTLGQIAGPPALTNTPLKADNATGGTYYSIEIDGTNATGGPGSATFTFTNADTVGTILTAINAQTNTTGVTATWDQASQRITLTSTAANSPAFELNDVPTPAGAGVPPATAAATTTANLREVFGLPQQIDVVSNLSTQLYNINAVINSVLSGRAAIGQQIQNLSATTSQLQAESTDNTSTKSGYEDTNVASATSQFTLVQTALQAAYATTTRLEGQNLMSYLTGTSVG